MNFADLDSRLSAAVMKAVMDDGIYTPVGTGVAMPIRGQVGYRDLDTGHLHANVRTVQVSVSSVPSPERGDAISLPQGSFVVAGIAAQDSQFVTLKVQDPD